MSHNWSKSASYPISLNTAWLPYLHGDLPVINQNLSSQEIGADCGLVASTELLVDLHMSAISLTVHSFVVLELQFARDRSWIECDARTYILVHQTRLAYTAVAKDNDLGGQ